MDAWMPSSLSGTLGLSLMAALLAVVAIVVFSGNYLRFRRRLPDPDLLPGERKLDEESCEWLLATSRFVLTDRRVLVQRLRWPFTSVTQSAHALADLASVTWSSGLNPILLLAAVVAFPYARPVSLLLFMLAMESMVASVALVPSTMALPLTRPRLSTFGNAHVAALHRFFRSALLGWTAMRATPMTPASAPVGAAAASDGELFGFRWGRPVWLAIAGIAAAAAVQRIAAGPVSYDHAAFAPIYLGVPVAIAISSLRDGAWTALLSVLAVFSVKFPAPLLGEGSPHPLQLLLILATLLVCCAIAAILAQRVHPLAAPLGLLPWPACVALDPGGVVDLRTLAITVLAMAVAAGVAALRALSLRPEPSRPERASAVA